MATLATAPISTAPRIVGGINSTPRLERLKAAPRKSGEASFFFWDAHFRNEAVKILPGEYFVHDEDVLITTTLGSCIAACLWDRERRIGGMNHFMLPEGTGDTGRYGSFAMELLINEMLKRGARRGGMTAKIFGGGQVVKSLAGTSIGDKNVAFVRAFLAQENIPITASDVLDIFPRKIVQFPRSGKVMCKRLPATHGAEFEAQEARYRAQLVQQPRGGDVGHVVVVGAGLVWRAERPAVLQAAAQANGQGWVQRAAVAHSVYVPEVRHPVEVKAQEEHLARWLTKRLEMPVKLFDLRAQGFELVGGRLLPDAKGPGAQLMYQAIGEAPAGQTPLRVTVYLRKPDDGTPAAFRYEQRGATGLFYWVEGATGYALVGPLPRERLLALAEAIAHQE